MSKPTKRLMSDKRIDAVSRAFIRKHWGKTVDYASLNSDLVEALKRLVLTAEKEATHEHRYEFQLKPEVIEALREKYE